MDGPIRSIFIGGVEQSRVDLTRPERLEFKYMQEMDVAVQLAFPPPAPLRALHVGGAGCALPWAWEVQRPGSRQLAYEIDPELARQVREWFPLPRKPALRIRVTEGFTALRASKAHFDVIVRDAFSGAQVPLHLQTELWHQTVQSHLRPRGLYLANSPHGLTESARGDVASAVEVFRFVALIGSSKVLKSARKGNLIVLAWDQPQLLDVPELDRQLRRLPLPASVLSGKEVERWLGGVRPAVGGAPPPTPGP